MSQDASTSTAADCIQEPQRKRTLSHTSITNAYSAKRQRISKASPAILKVVGYADRDAEFTFLGPETVADRFIPSRPAQSIPLNITPRSNRLARSFGLANDRILNYADTQGGPTAEPETSMHSLLRKSYSELFKIPPAQNTMSATWNIGSRKQFLLALDAPGISEDPFAYPVTWSSNNLIAVGCGDEVYYQNLDTKAISKLCSLPGPRHGRLHAIEWAGKMRPVWLATGSTKGVVEIWDTSGVSVRRWAHHDHLVSVGSMSWYDDLLSVGGSSGKISTFDMRMKKEVTLIGGAHKGKVHGVKWSTDGRYLASSDELGVVYIWDARACKSQTDGGKRGPKMKHEGPVKALAWCPWKPDLLATGSTFPEGKIRIWSTSSPFPSPPYEPIHTISLDTSVLSLHWSPHCKELLSTHGSSFSAPPIPRRRHRTNSTNNPPPQRHRKVQTAMTNSITVHEYPSCKRLVSITAHIGPVGHSCLSPDGTKVFTVCPQEEAMKMFKVWGTKDHTVKRDTAFDKFTIR